MGSSPLTASIHMLDDDSLLNVFHLYRPFLLGEDDDNENVRFVGGVREWARGRWWYKLAHVCQRWRDIVLRSASYLGVSLVCTFGTPVADMLAHSPPLPLVLDYLEEYGDITAEDEKGAIFALKQYDRVHRVRLQIPVTFLRNLIAAMDDEYPVLEYLIIGHPLEDKSSISLLPKTLQAPHLRQLTLDGFALPIRSRFLTGTMAVGLVTLCLTMGHPSTYFHPNTLLQWLSSMPQLETLAIIFFSPVPSRDVEKQSPHMPTTTFITLPNLHLFRFQGVGTYLEALVHQITAPRLERFQIDFFNQLRFSVPCLLQFVDTTENLRFKSVKFEFSDQGIEVMVYSHEEANMPALSIFVTGWHLDWQVSSAAQISNSLSPVFSAVELLTLGHKVHSQSAEEHNEADRTEWHKLIGPFINVKTLHIAERLVKELSRCLRLDDGEPPLELLPELEELTYFGGGNTGDAFTSFIDARQDAGRPLTLVRLGPSSDRSSSVSPLEPSSITPAGDEGDPDT